MKQVLVEMEDRVQKTETEHLHVIVQLYTKASCVNVVVSKRFKFLYDETYNPNRIFFFQFDHVTVDPVKMEEIVLMME